VHFYSNFGRKSRSNRGTVKQIAAGTRRRGAPERPRAPYATPASGPRPRLRGTRTFPRLSRAPRTPRSPPPSRHEPTARRIGPTGRGPRRTAGQTTIFPSCAVPRVKAGVLHPSAHPHLLLVKAPTAPRPWCRLRACQAATEPPAAPLQAATASSMSDRLHPPKSSAFPPPLAPTIARRRARRPRGAPPHRHSRPRRPPRLAAGAPPRRPLPGPSEHENRPPGTQGPSPTRARPAPAGGWPEFGRTAAGQRPGTTLQVPESFQGPPRKSITSIVFAGLLILVNCVENRKKFRKMQN
jgi:hypothetical protein